MYNHNYTYYYHTMTLTVYIIGIYVIIDPNSIHKKRPSTKCTRSFWGYRTKRVGFIGDGASKLLAPSLF